MTGYAELADQDHAERRGERGSDLGRYRNAAAGQR